MKKIYAGKSLISGKGIFAAEDIKKGQQIQRIMGKLIKRKLRSEKESKKFANWIGMGKDMWLNPNQTKFRYLNHSCDPSAAIVGTRTLVALKDIPKDGEITFDYSLTDADQYWQMKCKCGSKNCREIIKPIYSVAPEVFSRHYPHIPAKFQRLFLRTYIQKNGGGEKNTG